MTRPWASEKRYTPGWSGIEPGAGRYDGAGRDEIGGTTRPSVGGSADSHSALLPGRFAAQASKPPAGSTHPVTYTVFLKTVVLVSASGSGAGGLVTEPS